MLNKEMIKATDKMPHIMLTVGIGTNDFYDPIYGYGFDSYGKRFGSVDKVPFWDIGNTRYNLTEFIHDRDWYGYELKFNRNFPQDATFRVTINGVLAEFTYKKQYAEVDGWFMGDKNEGKVFAVTFAPPPYRLPLIAANATSMKEVA